jgi:hypothetical protein
MRKFLLRNAVSRTEHVSIFNNELSSLIKMYKGQNIANLTKKAMSRKYPAFFEWKVFFAYSFLSRFLQGSRYLYSFRVNKMRSWRNF